MRICSNRKQDPSCTANGSRQEQLVLDWPVEHRLPEAVCKSLEVEHTQLEVEHSKSVPLVHQLLRQLEQVLPSYCYNRSCCSTLVHDIRDNRCCTRQTLATI